MRQTSGDFGNAGEEGSEKDELMFQAAMPTL
jgi:hypothetical protein